MRAKRTVTGEGREGVMGVVVGGGGGGGDGCVCVGGGG